MTDNTHPKAAEVRELRRKNMPRRGLNYIEAAVYVGVGTAKFLELVKAGRLPQPRRIDRTTVWDMLELDIFFETFPQLDDIAQQRNEWGSS